MIWISKASIWIISKDTILSETMMSWATAKNPSSRFPSPIPEAKNKLKLPRLFEEVEARKAARLLLSKALRTHTKRINWATNNSRAAIIITLMRIATATTLKRSGRGTTSLHHLGLSLARSKTRTNLAITAMRMTKKYRSIRTLSLGIYKATTI